jgi:short-subunit dehydrogenase
MDGDSVFILGASRGLGLEIAKITFDLGAINIKASSSLTDGSKTVEGRVRKIYLNCDLRSLKSTQDFLCRLERQNPPINRFFWVAGQLLKGEFVGQRADEILSTIDINFRNSALVAHQVWKTMQSSGDGKSFTVIASSSGIKPRSDEAIYVATKHAQVGFARSLGLENRDSGLKISLFMPGGMQTPLWDGRRPADYGGFLDPARVARKIIDTVLAQQEPFLEMEIPRGSV